MENMITAVEKIVVMAMMMRLEHQVNQEKQVFYQPPEPKKTSFLFSDGSVSPLRNKLKHIAPLPNKPSIDNFSRPTTKMADISNNSISITPNRSNLEPIGQKQLSE